MVTHLWTFDPFKIRIYANDMKLQLYIYVVRLYSYDILIKMLQSIRPAGGIEPLRLSSATGLKPALQTTEAQQGNEI